MPRVISWKGWTVASGGDFAFCDEEAAHTYMAYIEEYPRSVFHEFLNQYGTSDDNLFTAMSLMIDD